VTDAEWAQIEALLPLSKQLGRPRTTLMRASCQYALGEGRLPLIVA
jgi:transposase